MSPRTLWLAFIFMLALGVGVTIPRLAPAESAANLTIAVADFNGADKELGRFIAEMLLTNLTQSKQLNLVERNEIRQALAELKLQSSGLVEPQQVKKLGTLVSADRLIVGSFLVREEMVIINARLLDVKTGRLAPGGAASVSGRRQDLLALTQRLAQQFHKRVTGNALEFEGADPSADPAPPQEETVQPRSKADVASDEPDALEPLRQKGLIPRSARPNQNITEAELIALVNKISRQIALQTDNPISPQDTNVPVTRLRVLTAMVKLIVPPGQVASYRENLPESMPPDTDQTPAWGRLYVAAALEQGLWRPEQPLKPRSAASWTFIGTLLTRMALLDTMPEPQPQRRSPEVVQHREPSDPDAYTGLIVDAGDLHLARAMSPRILDEEGSVVYPDPNHIPDYDYLLDNGLASYCESARDARRAGRRPLIVRAIDVTGHVGGDVVVSTRTANRIREANRRGQFLSRWSVCFLISGRE
jgi:TolB-like protein